MAPACRVVDALAQRALEVREAGGAAAEAHARAQVVAARRARVLARLLLVPLVLARLDAAVGLRRLAVSVCVLSIAVGNAAAVAVAVAAAATTAGDAYLEGYAVAHAEVGHVAAHGDYLAGSLVALREWLADLDVAIGVVCVVVHVRAAEGRAADRDLNLVCRRGWQRLRDLFQYTASRQ
ncbi:hypothetical protein VTK73DRAFT_5985 [Phialemonium thermophilum]|uniref:Uncharacterized protein n=1 Tax=Phialemonium thermophilum TaxID=223376 RepID=A0ABR3V059_9PEZI